MRVGVRETGAPAKVGDLDAVPGHHRHVLVLEDDDVARVREQRRNVGGEEGLPLPEPDHHAAGAVLGRDQPVRRVCLDSTTMA